MAGVVPVFLLNNQLPAFDQKPFTTAEICASAEQCSGYESIEGAQRIGGLWRLYPRSVEARNTLLVQGFSMRGVQVEIKDKNPFLIISPAGEEKEIAATKLIISNVPLSFSDEEMMKAVKKLGGSIRSKIIHERDRDKDGRLTRWKTGRRFIYISVPQEPLPRSVQIGPFKAILYHKEQKSTRAVSMECRKCFQKGHISTQCPNPIKCRQCFQDGHTAGDPACSLVPDSQNEESCQEKVPLVPSSCSQPWEGKTPEVLADTGRGRPAKRQRHSLQTKSGQTRLSFPRSSSRSASSKRPRSKDKNTDMDRGEILPPANLRESGRNEGSASDDDFEESNDSLVT